jgi:hypothetical protein
VDFLPVSPHGPGFHFAVDVSLDDKCEQPEPLVGLKQWVCVDLIGKISRDDGQRALISFNIRANVAEPCVEGVAPVARSVERLFRYGEIRSGARPIVQIRKVEGTL